MATSPNVIFTIDDRQISVPPGTLVIEAARRRASRFPSFCYYPGLTLQAACRMCLVEVEKTPKLQTACTLVAAKAWSCAPTRRRSHQARKNMLEFLLTNHPLDCPVCDKGGECELQDMTFRYGADRSRFVEEKLHTPEEKWSPSCTTTRRAASCASAACASATKAWAWRRWASASAARSP